MGEPNTNEYCKPNTIPNMYRPILDGGRRKRRKGGSTEWELGKKEGREEERKEGRKEDKREYVCI